MSLHVSEPSLISLSSSLWFSVYRPYTLLSDLFLFHIFDAITSGSLNFFFFFFFNVWGFTANTQNYSWVLRYGFCILQLDETHFSVLGAFEKMPPVFLQKRSGLGTHTFSSSLPMGMPLFFFFLSLAWVHWREPECTGEQNTGELVQQWTAVMRSDLPVLLLIVGGKESSVSHNQVC